MPLTPDQQQTVATHLNTRGQAPKCPVCGASNLRVLPDLTEVSLDTGPDAVRHLVNVECKYCAHLLHFSARAIGVGPEAEPDAAETDGMDGQA
jgi:hypothetical protein